MDRPDKVNQGFLNRLPRPSDMPDVPWVQWRVENLEEVAKFLDPYKVRMQTVPGDQLIVQTAFTRGDIQLSPGDCLALIQHEGREQLAVVRQPASLQVREGDGFRKEHSNMSRLKRWFNKPRLLTR